MSAIRQVSIEGKGLWNRRKFGNSTYCGLVGNASEWCFEFRYGILEHFQKCLGIHRTRDNPWIKLRLVAFGIRLAEIENKLALIVANSEMIGVFSFQFFGLMRSLGAWVHLFPRYVNFFLAVGSKSKSDPVFLQSKRGARCLTQALISWLSYWY